MVERLRQTLDGFEELDGAERNDPWRARENIHAACWSLRYVAKKMGERPGLVVNPQRLLNI